VVTNKGAGLELPIGLEEDLFLQECSVLDDWEMDLKVESRARHTRLSLRRRRREIFYLLVV
jgi:hypothetical protein